MEVLDELRRRLFGWICAVLFYGFGDVISTWLVLEAGGRELNPLIRFFLDHMGRDLGTLWGVKALFLTALFLGSLLLPKKERWVVPAMLIGMGLMLMVCNLISFKALV